MIECAGAAAITAVAEHILQLDLPEAIVQSFYHAGFYSEHMQAVQTGHRRSRQIPLGSLLDDRMRNTWGTVNIISSTCNGPTNLVLVLLTIHVTPEVRQVRATSVLLAYRTH